MDKQAELKLLSSQLLDGTPTKVTWAMEMI